MIGFTGVTERRTLPEPMPISPVQGSPGVPLAHKIPGGSPDMYTPIAEARPIHSIRQYLPPLWLLNLFILDQLAALSSSTCPISGQRRRNYVSGKAWRDRTAGPLSGEK